MTGLNYLNARYYNSKVGQFVSQDPVFWTLDKDYLLDPQQWNSYSYGRNNPLILTDRNGKKVELGVRQVFSKYDGHLVFIITPDNPDQISIKGVPSGTKQFTVGAYNRGGVFGIGNKLTPEFGYEGMEHQNTDLPYLLNEKELTAKITITPPNGQSDTDFINSLGAEANNTEKESYFTLGQRLKFGNANSNNYVYEIGKRVGVEDQISNFSKFSTNHVYVPGGGRGLPRYSLRQQIRSLIKQISTLKQSQKKENN